MESVFDVVVQKLKNIRFPFGDTKVEQVVPIICDLADRGIDSEQMGFVEPVEFRRDSFPGVVSKSLAAYRSMMGAAVFPTAARVRSRNSCDACQEFAPAAKATSARMVLS